MKAYLKIAALMKSEGRSMVWLASKIGISVGHLNNILKGNRPLLETHLRAINKILNTNFSTNTYPNEHKKKSAANVS